MREAHKERERERKNWDNSKYDPKREADKEEENKGNVWTKYSC